MQLPGLNGDALLKAVAPTIQKAVEPMIADARASLLKALAGPPPASFIARVQNVFDMTEEEVTGIWLHAVDSAAELVAGK